MLLNREATAQAYYVMVAKFNMRQFSHWQISLTLEEEILGR